ncbi:MAG: hypothetical protein K9M54_06305 [Kiritimatiellales bacterium]|nr:hypothetical protein [Kiritimatiellales bacterium]MCF7863282.1 hypothetical protein [Kiritimatiellales bacterium]
MHNFISKYATENFGSSKPLWDVPLFESESFVALPSIGSLVEGWMLVVPKEFALNIGFMDEKLQNELLRFSQKVARVLEKEYGPIAAFEHGPIQRNNKVGCGVDYAHLHLVPTSHNLLDEAKKLDTTIEWVSVDSIKQTSQLVKQGCSYLFLQQPYGHGKAYVGTSKHIPSQLFRRILANHLNSTTDFDWKSDPRIEIVEKTVNKLSNHSDLFPKELLLQPA